MPFTSRSSKNPVNFPLYRILTSHLKRGRGISSFSIYYVFTRLDSHQNTCSHWLSYSCSPLFIFSHIYFLGLKYAIACHHDSDRLMPTLFSSPKYTHFSLCQTSRKNFTISELVCISFLFIYTFTYFFNVHLIKM